MSLATSQLRVLFLTMYRNDLQFKLQLISQTKLQLSSSINELVGIGNDLDPDSPEMKLLEQRRQKLLLVEQRLDAAMQRYKTQLQAVETEIQSAEKFVQDNIKSSFSYGR